MNKEKQKMIKKMLPIGVAILTAISGIIILSSLVLRYLVPLYLEYKFNVSTEDASTIGIIGSADGPSSIYISNKSEQILMPVFLLVFIMGIIYFAYRKLRRKKED